MMVADLKSNLLASLVFVFVEVKKNIVILVFVRYAFIFEKLKGNELLI